jgi:hypothetical protein
MWVATGQMPTIFASRPAIKNWSNNDIELRRRQSYLLLLQVHGKTPTPGHSGSLAKNRNTIEGKFRLFYKEHAPGCASQYYSIITHESRSNQLSCDKKRCSFEVLGFIRESV